LQEIFSIKVSDEIYASGTIMLLETSKYKCSNSPPDFYIAKNIKDNA